MKTLYDFRYDLTEKVSSVVYHKTTMEAISNILETDQFSLAGTAFVDNEKLLPVRDNSKNMYYMSFSQSKRSLFNRDAATLDGILTIDGDTLSQKYRGGAVDWTNRQQHHLIHNFGDRFQNDESEDRVVSNKPFIPNATKYIKAIDVIIPYRMRLDGVFSNKKAQIKRNFRDIMRIAKLKGIPVRVYDLETQKYILTGKNYLKPEEYDYMYDGITTTQNSIKKEQDSMRVPGIVRDLYSLSKIMTSNSESDFDDETKKHFDKLKLSLSYAHPDSIDIMWTAWWASYVFADSRLSSNELAKKYYHKIHSVIIKNKLKTPFHIAQFISDKYGMGYNFIK